MNDFELTVLPLKNPFAGAPVYFAETVSSTMEAAKQLAAHGAPSGTVIAAGFQEAGRGRLGRAWEAARGANLLFTIFLSYSNFSCRLSYTNELPAALTLKAGLALSLAIEDAFPALADFVRVKWPNDIMLCNTPVANLVAKFNADKPSVANIVAKPAAYKIAGILCEADGENVFIGIGVNVLQKDFSQGVVAKEASEKANLKSKAGSIAMLVPELQENAKTILLEKILARLFLEVNAQEHLPAKNALQENAPHKQPSQASWQERLNERLYKKGEPVIFAPGAASTENVVEGMLLGIGSGGELRLLTETEGGAKQEQAFVTGELRVY